MRTTMIINIGETNKKNSHRENRITIKLYRYVIKEIKIIYHISFVAYIISNESIYEYVYLPVNDNSSKQFEQTRCHIIIILRSLRHRSIGRYGHQFAERRGQLTPSRRICVYACGVNKKTVIWRRLSRHICI